MCQSGWPVNTLYCMKIYIVGMCLKLPCLNETQNLERTVVNLSPGHSIIGWKYVYTTNLKHELTPAHYVIIRLAFFCVTVLTDHWVPFKALTLRVKFTTFKRVLQGHGCGKIFMLTNVFTFLNFTGLILHLYASHNF